MEDCRHAWLDHSGGAGRSFHPDEPHSNSVDPLPVRGQFFSHERSYARALRVSHSRFLGRHLMFDRRVKWHASWHGASCERRDSTLLVDRGNMSSISDSTNPTVSGRSLLCSERSSSFSVHRWKLLSPRRMTSSILRQDSPRTASTGSVDA
jgi:hypothetical protein